MKPPKPCDKFGCEKPREKGSKHCRRHKPKPCKLCPTQRYANQSLCWKHYHEAVRIRREENRAKKLQRKLASKGYQENERKNLIDKCDAVFSKLIRARDQRCLHCGKGPDQAQLHCSHVYSRKNLSVRWDEMNAKALCAYHHRRFWHEQPKEALEWLTGLWGEDHMAELKVRANSVKIWTTDELRALLSDLTEKLSKL